MFKKINLSEKNVLKMFNLIQNCECLESKLTNYNHYSVAFKPD